LGQWNESPLCKITHILPPVISEQSITYNYVVKVLDKKIIQETICKEN